MNEPQVTDAGAEATLATLLADPAALATRFKAVVAAVESEHEARLAALDHKLDQVAAAKAEQVAHAEELTRREARVAERERQVAADLQRVIDRERWVENRAADLTNRLHGVA
jgi:hypothetical protein